MVNKPSHNEEAYFANIELERRKKRQDEQERKKSNMLPNMQMKCPKCDRELVKSIYLDFTINKCEACKGVWVDSERLDQLTTKNS
ncbi:MAG: zf-TFIIB domain-containing protein [Oligoflexia bacterium]|nr:zf-TFIIB domain-containing protein [Oligoflexia bacterium]